MGRRERGRQQEVQESKGLQGKGGPKKGAQEGPLCLARAAAGAARAAGSARERLAARGGGPADQREPLARGARAPEGAHCYALGRSRLPLSCNTLAPWQRATGTARGLEITAPFPWRPGSDSRPRPARHAPPAPRRGRLPLHRSAPVTLATATAAQTPTAAGPAPFPHPSRPPARGAWPAWACALARPHQGPPRAPAQEASPPPLPGQESNRRRKSHAGQVPGQPPELRAPSEPP